MLVIISCDNFNILYNYNEKQRLPWVVLKVKVTKSCLTLCNPTDCTVHVILQARIPEWVAVPFSRGSSQRRDQTQVSLIAGRFFTCWATVLVVKSSLPMQGTSVWSLVREDSMLWGATKPVFDNYWTPALELVLHNSRGHCNEKPRISTKERPPLVTTREKLMNSNKGPAQPKRK